jgi:hypothetical protein
MSLIDPPRRLLQFSDMSGIGGQAEVVLIL